MHTINHSLDRLRPIAPLVVRVTVGIIFLWHGIDKFDTGISNVEGAFDGWGVPVPGLTAPFTAVLEIVAGAALIIGLGTRFAAAALAALMVGSILYVKAENGLIAQGGAELDLALLVASLSLVATGPGILSADQALGWERLTTSSPSPRVDEAVGVRARSETVIITVFLYPANEILIS